MRERVAHANRLSLSLDQTCHLGDTSRGRRQFLCCGPPGSDQAQEQLGSTHAWLRQPSRARKPPTGRTLGFPIQPCNRRPTCRGYRLSSRRRDKNVCPRACRRRCRFRTSASRLSSRSPPGLHFGESCCKPEGVPSLSQCCASCGRGETEGEGHPRPLIGL